MCIHVDPKCNLGGAVNFHLEQNPECAIEDAMRECLEHLKDYLEQAPTTVKKGSKAKKGKQPAGQVQWFKRGIIDTPGEGWQTWCGKVCVIIFSI